MAFFSYLVAFIVIFILLLRKRFKYWEIKKVPTGKVLPIFGDCYEICMGFTSRSEMLVKMYNKVPSYHRYVGAYLFHVPVFIPKDADLIYRMCTSDFEYFGNHGNIILNSADQLWQKSPYVLKGKEWKEANLILTKMLRSRKIENIFPNYAPIIENFIKFIKDKDQEIVEIDSKECLLKLGYDLASEITLGFKTNSFEIEKKDKTVKDFVKACDLRSPFKRLLLVLYTLCDAIPKLFGMTLFGECQSFISEAVEFAIRQREERTAMLKVDLIGLTLAAREEQLKARAEAGENGNNIKITTNEEIASYVFLVYLGLMEPVSTTLSFLIWELARSPDIQERLFLECARIPEGRNKLVYQDIINLGYMDMVLSEALRKWPPVIATDRVVTKPYSIAPELPHEVPVSLSVGDNILIPIYALHRDPKYYEDPDKFDPERFSRENVSKLKAKAFIPFGSGRRFCIGIRISVVIMKAIMYHLLRSFEIVPVERTAKYMVMDTEGFGLFPVGGFPIGFKRRVKISE